MKLRLLTLLLALLFLSACVPVQEGAERAVRAIGAGDDGATIAIHDAGVTFDPASETALQVVLYVGGENLQESEEVCEPLGNGVACFLEDVESPVTVAVLGTDMSANVSYYRTGRSSPLFFYVRE